MPRDFKRSERVSGQLRRELAQIIQQEIKDPEVGLVSVSDVEVTRDLAHAKVYITVFNPEQAADSIKALKRAAGFLRSRLGQELSMRTVPQIHIVHDNSVEIGQQMDGLIEQAVKADKNAPADDSATIADTDADK
ncbi:MAG: ribosome-binding factor A [Rhodothermales bacterium]|jgi:ribosome-binding factor A